MAQAIMTYFLLGQLDRVAKLMQDFQWDEMNGEGRRRQIGYADGGCMKDRLKFIN